MLRLLEMGLLGVLALTILGDEEPVCPAACECSVAVIPLSGGSPDPCLEIIVVQGLVKTKGCCPNAANETCPSGNCVSKAEVWQVVNGCYCVLDHYDSTPGSLTCPWWQVGETSGNMGGGTLSMACEHSKTYFSMIFCALYPAEILYEIEERLECRPGSPCIWLP
jgi:hypothetical protein